MTNNITLPRATVQQALEALENSSPDQYPEDAGVYYDAKDALRTALEQQAEPVSHAAIAGALFDFMGWLTTRKERLVLSSTDNASPAVESITEFAKMRGLSLNDAKVQDWNTSLPQQQAEPVAWQVMVEDGAMKEFPIKDMAHDWCVRQKLSGASYAYWIRPLYTTPPQRQWVGLTDEEITELRLKTFDAVATNYESYRAIEAKLRSKNDH